MEAINKKEPDKLIHNSSISMNKRTFDRFSAFIQSRLGIKMPSSKKTMLQTRLLKRLKPLGMTCYKDYYDYLFTPEGKQNELQNMIDVITTNKTDFLREPTHFDYLVETVLPELLAARNGTPHKKISMWSAGCSTGEEPYSIAMMVMEFLSAYPAYRPSILATAISRRVLRRAANAVYDHARIECLPMALRKKYLLRKKGENNQVRIAPMLRSLITFHQLNFLEPNFRLSEKMDVIFCRNVLIYFERETQYQVLKSICRHLKPQGHLFVGHSETLHGLDLPLVQVKSTIYQKSERLN